MLFNGVGELFLGVSSRRLIVQLRLALPLAFGQGAVHALACEHASRLRGHVTFSYPLLQIAGELYAEIFLGQLHVRFDAFVERLEITAPHRRSQLERQQKIILTDIVVAEIFGDVFGLLSLWLECLQTLDVGP